MRDKALTNFILAAALSTTLFQLSDGWWIAQVIVISILGVSALILWIGHNIRGPWWIRLLNVADTIEIKMTGAGFSLSSVGVDYLILGYVAAGAIFLVIGAPLFGKGIADNIMNLRRRNNAAQTGPNQDRILTATNRFGRGSATKFLITEYQQSFSHMRHYDSIVLALSRYLLTFFAAIFTASIVLYQYLGNAPYQNLVMGIISLLSFLVGGLLLVFILRNRHYYTIVARQVNSIRNYFLNNMDLDFSQYNVSYTNPDEPKLWNMLSSYTLLYFIVGLMNSAIAGTSYLFLCMYFRGVTIEEIWLVGVLIAVAVFILCLRHNKREPVLRETAFEKGTT